MNNNHATTTPDRPQPQRLYSVITARIGGLVCLPTMKPGGPFWVRLSAIVGVAADVPTDDGTAGVGVIVEGGQALLLSHAPGLPDTAAALAADLAAATARASQEVQREAARAYVESVTDAIPEHMRVTVAELDRMAETCQCRACQERRARGETGGHQ